MADKTIKSVTRKSPTDALKELTKTCDLKYIIYEDNFIYKGFDISHLSAHKIAEVILLNNTPVQVRTLADKPYGRHGFVYQAGAETKELKFGGF